MAIRDEPPSLPEQTTALNPECGCPCTSCRDGQCGQCTRPRLCAIARSLRANASSLKRALQQHGRT